MIKKNREIEKEKKRANNINKKKNVMSVSLQHVINISLLS